jgi:hypothetical protein
LNVCFRSIPARHFSKDFALKNQVTNQLSDIDSG